MLSVRVIQVVRDDELLRTWIQQRWWFSLLI